MLISHSLKLLFTTFLPFLLFWRTGNGQPTIPEAALWRSDSCHTKDISDTLHLLKQEIENLRLENGQLRSQLSALAEQNRQARVVLGQLVDTMHLLVSSLAERYPCKCDV